MGALKELCGNIVTVMIVMIRIWRVSKVRLRSAKCADQLSDLMLANHTSESECCRKTRKWKWSWKFYWTNHLKIVTYNAQRLWRLYTADIYSRQHTNQTQCNQILKVPSKLAALCVTAVALLSPVRSLVESVSRFMSPSHSHLCSCQQHRKILRNLCSFSAVSW